MVSNIGISMNWPRPVFSREYSAARMACAATSPLVLSQRMVGA